MDKEIYKISIAQLAIELREIELDIHRAESELSGLNCRYRACRDRLDELIDEFTDGLKPGEQIG